MTQVKLWQIVSNTPNGMIWSDATGSIVTIPQGAPEQVLVIDALGQPAWVDNAALNAAILAQTSAADAVTIANAYTEAQIAALVDNAPIALNTLNELAVKLATEESAINALILQVDNKADSTAVTSLVAQAKQEAITASATHADASVSAALVTASATSQGQATAARAAAESAAALDASTKVDDLRSNIPDAFRVEGRSVACFLADGGSLPQADLIGFGVNIRGLFFEITGANTSAVDSSLFPKMVFINGVAVSGWSVAFSGDHALLQMDPALATHLYDGSANNVMVIAEYKTYGSITATPAPIGDQANPRP